MKNALRAVLDAVVAGDPRGAVAAADAAFAQDGNGLHRAHGAFAAFLASDYPLASTLAAEALAIATDVDSRHLARAASGLANAGAPGAGDPLADARSEFAVTPASGFTAYLLTEAAIANARLDLAAEFATHVTPLDHDFDAMVQVTQVRVLAFRGRIAEATELLATIPVHDGLLGLLVRSTETLVRGNAAERAGVRALADELEAAEPDPRDYLTAGCYLLVAFGLVAVGDVSRAARLALRAGGDADLSRLNTVDRGLTYELLVSAAAIEGDVDAADSWHLRAQSLLDSPIACSTIERLNSRIALLHGDADAAVTWGDRAVASARAEGRVIEAAEGEIVAARARIASSQTGDASARLEALVEDADRSGFVAARRSAARELRAAGRRLRPRPGSEWAGLSERERDVALMVAEGLGNREIATELHLSEHTVRAHVSRVLAAFGAASRFVVAARIAELFPETSSDPVPDLTPRQEAVAACISRGAGNAEIGAELELSVKTVEKHVGEIFRRWDVASRVGIARRYRSLRQAPS